LREGGSAFRGDPIALIAHAREAGAAISDEFVEKRIPGAERFLQLRL